MLRGPTRHRDASISHERISPEDDPRHLRLIEGVGKGGETPFTQIQRRTLRLYSL